MNYYNEFDPKAAAWLRELIAAKLIPQGEVDTRSIKDVRADDLRGFTQCHFFAGIGGWSLALKLARWSEDKPVWTGSCPCQSFSSAGKQKGANDERDLWPVFFELIRACRPEFVFGEQVEAAIKHGWLDRVCANMEREDYTVGAVVLGAHSVSAPHLRQRLYWGATRMAEDSASIGCGGRNNGDSAGDSGQVQAQRLGNGCGVADVSGDRREWGRSQRTFEEGREQESGHAGELPDGLEGLCPDFSVADTGLLGQEIKQEQTAGNVKCSNVGRLADDLIDGMSAGISRQDERKEGNSGESFNDRLSGFSPWSDFGLVYCQDHKVRRVPAESLFFGVADGISEGMDEVRNLSVLEVERGFPICKKEEEIGRTMLLKGYGNAIVPQVAAEFIRAFEEEAK